LHECPGKCRLTSDAKNFIAAIQAVGIHCAAMTKYSQAEQTTGQGGLQLLRIQTPWSVAEIYLQGATVTHFQKNGEVPLGTRNNKAPPLLRTL
jgi:hypothetical protein